MPLIVNGVEIENLIVINTATGEQVEIETLQDQLGNILFQKQTAPAWFNYTGIDANGNYEGTSAYDGVAVAYGIGKPTLVTNDDGTITLANNFAEANGLNDDYFIEKYGDSYVKEWDALTEATPLQVVEDILVIPDKYNNLPVTTILSNSFYASNYTVLGGIVDTKWQSYFYKQIVFGENISEIHNRAFYGCSIELLALPNTISKLGVDICGVNFTAISNYEIIPKLEVNSNITPIASGLYNSIQTVIFNTNVTYLKDIINYSLGFNDYVWVFKQPKDLQVEIVFSSKPKTAHQVAIYTDNDSVKNYDWSTNGNITPTFYPLSDYVG